MATFPAPIKSLMYFKEKMNAVWLEWFRGIDDALPSGDIVDTSSVQTLTNKGIDADDNTVSNLAHGAEVDNPSSGVHGVTGSVVGTTDSQVLSGKTLTSPVLNTQATGTAVLDEDNMASDSALKVATQQSIKAYADTYFIAKAGGTMTGGLLLRDLNNADPVTNKPAGTAAEVAFNSNTIVGFFGCTVTGGGGASTWVAL